MSWPAPKHAPTERANGPSLARDAASAALAPHRHDEAAVRKVQTCLLDVIGAALESRGLPWGCQAVGIASEVKGGVPIIGTARRTTVGDAAFANAVLAHGLVREDMHAASISHLGVVVIPVLLALSRSHRVSGMRFINAAVAGYEVGARIGAALFTTELARLFRPTGITGPIGGAAAAAVLLGLDVNRAASAIGMAANATGGLNEWPAVGGTEMFFHPGFAARNAVTAARLAELGAEASESALDGEAGLFAAFRRDGMRPVIRFFDGAPEIMAVYNKPVPACNFAQTACQLALRLSREHGVRAGEIQGIQIRVPRAAARYPGCDSTGPFSKLLQAKMSIPFGVAATLLRGTIEEANYHLPVGAEMERLLDLVTLEEDAALTAAFPVQQGAEIALELADRVVCGKLDDVVAATPAEVRERFERAATDSLGRERAEAILRFVDAMPDAVDMAPLADLLALQEDGAP
nr:MmgE/PrpD family protein [Roseomonas aerilata]